MPETQSNHSRLFGRMDAMQPEHFSLEVKRITALILSIERLGDAGYHEAANEVTETLVSEVDRLSDF